MGMMGRTKVYTEDSELAPDSPSKKAWTNSSDPRLKVGGKLSKEISYKN
jgi:hypothetical protein